MDDIAERNRISPFRRDFFFKCRKLTCFVVNGLLDGLELTGILFGTERVGRPCMCVGSVKENEWK